MVKRVILAGATLLLGGVFFVGGASPAAAEISGPCKGSGTFTKIGTVDGNTSETVEVPIKDSVDWQGSIEAPAGEQPYSGKIEVELPPPFPAVKIDDWSGTTDSSGNNGTKKYDIPSWVPRNVELEVSGNHTQGSVSCSGSVKIKLEGGVFDSVAAPVSVVATVFAALGMAFAARPK
jgi:hypothetical protein